MPVFSWDGGTCSTATTAWITWNTTSTAGTAWTAWNTNTVTLTHATGGSYDERIYYRPAPPETDEQLRIRLAREDELAVKRKARELQFEEAKVRAAELLRRLLTDEQWDAWVKDSAFDLTAESGNQYRIKRGISNNVIRIEDGKPVEKLCIHPSTAVHDDDRNYLGDMPTEDVVVAQLLHLQADEPAFRRVANITPIRAAA